MFYILIQSGPAQTVYTIHIIHIKHAWIQEFSSGGVQVSLTKKAQTFYFSQLILQKSNGQFQRNLLFFKVPEGVQHFPGGSNFFQVGGGGGGGSNCLFPIETHITCDFPGGGVRTPVLPSGSALVKQLKMSSILAKNNNI